MVSGVRGKRVAWRDGRMRWEAQTDAWDLYRSKSQRTRELYKQHMAIRCGTAWCICER